MKYILSFLAFVVVLGFAYLCGAFIGNSFNIGDWDAGGRAVVVLLGNLAAFAAAGSVMDNMKK